MSKEKQLKGKRYVALARCSSQGQVDTSIDEQLRLIENFGRQQGMVCVGTVALGGLTGSVPGIRQDIDELVRRKQEDNDFEVVVIQDATRLTRSGSLHGMHILYRLRSIGVQVVFVKDDLPEGDMGDVMGSLLFYAGKQQAEGIAFASTRGAAASLYQGKTPHCKAPPYGLDRLYLSEDGTPKHVIRNLTDGTQVKLHPVTRAVLETFGRNQKSGVPNHYIKQKSERIELVPGDPACVAVVEEIFRRHFADAWGYYRIAQELNGRGVPSPRGTLWSTASIRAILLNPVYLGVGLANVLTSALYYMRGADGPMETPVTEQERAQGRPRARVRDRSAWYERPEPRLNDFLGSALKVMATAKQQARLEALATPKPEVPNRDRHRDSSFILKTILRARQGGYAMTGRRTGKATCKKRYYAVNKAFGSPTKDKVLRRMIPADPLEEAVLAALVQVLTNCERVHEMMEAVVRRELRAQVAPDTSLDDLHKEKASIEQKLGFVLDEMDQLGQQAVRAKVQQLQARLQVVVDEIRRKAAPRPDLDDPGPVADALCKRLHAFADEVSARSPAALRELLQSFVSKLVIDLETREGEIVFSLPEWGTLDLGKVCLVGDSAYKTDNQAHPLVGIPLAAYRLAWDTGSNQFVCTVMDQGIRGNAA
jgi:hypothetical protein